MTVALARSLTDMGNLAVVGIAGLSALLALLVQCRFSLALRLGACGAATFISTFALKLVSAHFGPHFRHTPFELTHAAPSGHASMAMVVYGGIALVCWRGAERRVGMAAALLALTVIACVAITRVTLHAHSPADVASGLLVGAVCLLLCRRENDRVAKGANLALLIVVALAALALHASGMRISSDQFI